LQSFGDAGLVERLQNIIHGVHVEGLDGVVVEGRGENNLRDAEFAFEEFFDNAEAIEAGHLHVEEHKVGFVLLDQRDGFEAVLAQGNHVHFGKALQQIEQFVARGALVVHNDCIDCHGVCRKQYMQAGYGRQEIRQRWVSMMEIADCEEHTCPEENRQQKY